MLRITVTSHDAKPLAQPLAAEFGAQGGTIGRAPESTLVLPDPDRVISRTHAFVTCRDGVFLLRDHGTAVPVFHNARALGSGREARLDAGDEIRIGKYVLQVEMARPVHATDAAGDLAATMVNLRADLRGSPAEVPDDAVLSWTGDVADGGGIRSVVIPAPDAEGGRPAPRSAPIEPKPSARAGTAATAAAPGGSAGGVDDAAGPGASADRAPGNIALADGERITETFADDPLLRAFLDGAQLDGVALPGALTPERMREIGQILRESVRGLLDLLAARTLAKREVRADATAIVTRDDDPFASAPSVEAAITRLVMPGGEASARPLAAVTDAYASLQTHQQAFVAGMRAALGAVLARLDPRALPDSLEEESFADSLLPMSREARLWDAFERLHADVSREADADFHALWGREFLRAYEARVAELHQAGAGPPGS